MKNKISLSVILPIKSSQTKDFNEFFDKAVKSVTEQRNVEAEDLIIVHTKEETLIKFLDTYDFGELKVTKVLYEGEPTFSAQVNLGVKNAKTDWVTILEFDDEYSNIWFENVASYIGYYPEINVFMPIVVDTDIKNQFAGFTNEAAFAANISKDMGVIDNGLRLDYQKFQSSGMVIKKTAFESVGGFKASIRLTFVYEFLLRLTYNSNNIMVIPKIGYKHMNMREGSIFWNYKFGENKISEDEVKFWLQTAKKEYFFANDRNIKYESK